MPSSKLDKLIRIDCREAYLQPHSNRNSMAFERRESLGPLVLLSHRVKGCIGIGNRYSFPR